MKVKYVGGNLYGANILDRIVTKNSIYEVVAMKNDNFVLLDNRGKKYVCNPKNIEKI